MSRDITPFPVRLPPELRERLEGAAKEAGRSLNAEILHQLQNAVGTGGPDAAKRSVFLEELREAAREVVRYWDIDDRDEMDNKILGDAIDDLERWEDRLDELDRKKR